MIYLDTSALVKLIFDETESAPLAEWLASGSDIPKISTDLTAIELLRACRRADERAKDGALERADLLLGGIDLLPIDRAIVDKAASLVPTELRSLDAIHLASALSVKSSLTAFAAYDARLCSAAADAGIEVVSPT